MATKYYDYTVTGEPGRLVVSLDMIAAEDAALAGRVDAAGAAAYSMQDPYGETHTWTYRPHGLGGE